jgi:hypothetical protein
VQDLLKPGRAGYPRAGDRWETIRWVEASCLHSAWSEVTRNMNRRRRLFVWVGTGLREPRVPILALVLAALGAPACADDGDGRGATTVTGSDRLNVTTGALPLYHVQVKPRNDASGAVFLPSSGKLLVVDDGGDDQKPDRVPLYLADVASLFAAGPAMAELPATAEALLGSFPDRHRDMEGATSDGRFIYVTTSLPSEAEPNKMDAQFRAFSRFRIEGDRIVDGTTIDPRAAVIDSLARPTADPWFADWLDRWTVKFPNSKDCGLNIEALSRTPQANQLLLGVRSPHYGPDFCQPDAESGKPKTRNGAAIVLKVDVGTFEQAALAPVVHATLDLGGLGFRGMEYSPAARGYFITAGAVEAGFDYAFFFWNGDPGSRPVPLAEKIPEFGKLCRPESVEEIEQGGRHYLLVLSEESGTICEMPPQPYNYLLIELNRSFLAMLE